MIRFSKRGVSTVEYAVLLAFVTIVAGCFLPDNFTSPINNIITKLGYVMDRKKDISNMDDFAQALKDTKTKIKIKGQDEREMSLMELLGGAGPFSSAAIGVLQNGEQGDWKAQYNGQKYQAYTGAINQILADNGFAGYENYTWTISNKTLYIVDRKMDSNDIGKQHTVTTYNLSKNPPTPGSANMYYKQGSFGGYFNTTL